MTEDLLAIDVVLLPPPAVDRLCRDLNAGMRAAAAGGLALDDEHIPHLTLLQQAIAAADLEPARAAIAAALRGQPALALRAVSTRRTGTTAHLVIAPEPGLRALHDRLHGALAGLARTPVTAAAFHPGEPPRDRDVEWVERFRGAASGERFDPHVTLGIGEPPPLREPVAFVAAEAALCRLGRYCTCREVLAAWPLPAPPAAAGRSIPTSR